MKMLDIWINCPDQATAQKISTALLSERLVACANIYPEIQSAYHWKGQIEHDTEVPLLVKTLARHFDAVVAKVRETHPYETPAITGVPVDKVNEDYLQWLDAETA
jgi:periplasmic divalent cation tolerance protein